MTSFLLIPLDDTVVFPNMSVTLTVDTGGEERVLLVPRHENEYASVGTVAEVLEEVRLPGGVRAVALNGLHRAVIGAASSDASGQLRAEVEECPDENPAPTADARARDAVPRRRRGDSRAARCRRADLRLHSLDLGAGRTRATPPATRPS